MKLPPPAAPAQPIRTLAADAEPAAPRRSFLSSAALTWATQLAVGVLSLGNVLVVARALGSTGRGEVAFLTTVAYLTSQLALLGVDQANINFASAEPRLRSALATNSVLLAVLLGAASVGVVAGLIALFPKIGGPTPAALRWLMLGSVPMLILQVYLLLLVRADYAFGLANVAYLLGPLVNVTVNAAFALAGLLTVGTAVATWIAGQALGTALMVWHLTRRSAGFGRPDGRLAVRSLGFGAKAQAGRALLLGNYRLDQWILGAIVGARELGRYSVAVAWAETLFYLPTALAAVHRPDLVRSDRGAAAREAGMVFRAAVIVTIPLVLVLVLAAPFLCVTLFGAGFRGSVEQLRILSLGAFGIVALKLFGNALTAQRKPMLETAAVALAFLATLGLDIALIPAHGGIGASLASTVAYSAGGIAAGLLLARALGATGRDLVPRGRDAAALWRRIAAAFATVARVRS
jgi:O-antigen/teichoic acid export membrane protein